VEAILFASLTIEATLTMRLPGWRDRRTLMG